MPFCMHGQEGGRGIKTTWSPPGPVGKAGVEFFSSNGKNTVRLALSEGEYFTNFITLAKSSAGIWCLQSQQIPGTLKTVSSLIPFVPVRSADDRGTGCRRPSLPHATRRSVCTSQETDGDCGGA